MVMLSSLKLLSCRSSSEENETPRETRSLGVKCPRNRFTTCPKEVIFSQETLIRCGEPNLQVQGAIVFHMGQSGIPTDSPRMDSNSADMMAMVFISFSVCHSHWCSGNTEVVVAVRWLSSDCGGWRLNFLVKRWGGASSSSSSSRGALCMPSCPMLVAH